MCIVNEHQLSKGTGISKIETNLLVFLTVPTAALRFPDIYILYTRTVLKQKY